MKNRYHISLIYVSVLVFVLFSASLQGPAQDDIYDFAISESFLKWMYEGKTIQPVLKIHLTHRTGRVHTLREDCEIHIAGTPEKELGVPNDIVIEPPNLCKFAPEEVEFSSETKLRNEIWPNTLDDKVMNKTCEVKGFLRIFTEHAHGGIDPANPNHVFEVHPAMSIKADTETVSFEDFLTVFEGMGHIKPSSVESCIKNRQLCVRYNESEKQYEFREEGGRCGNFAIVEVVNVRKEWIHSLNGGHSAIARISPDGESRTTLKLYTLTDSDADAWLQDIMNGNQQSSARKLLHGLITYDYYSIIKAVKKKEVDE